MSVVKLESPKEIDRFFNKVRFDEACWIWVGALLPNGYGRVGIRKWIGYVHRVAYETWIGTIQEGNEIDHLCKTRACVNPDHLEQVSHAENMRRSTKIYCTICGDEKTSSLGRCLRCKRRVQRAYVERKKCQ